MTRISDTSKAITRDVIKVCEGEHVERGCMFPRADAASEVAVIALAETAREFSQRENIPIMFALAVITRLCIEEAGQILKEEDA